MNKKSITKKIVLCLTTLCFALTLFGCGGDSKKAAKVDGYYTLSTPGEIMGTDHYAIEINGSDVVFHTDRYGTHGYNLAGNIEYADGKASMYIPDISTCKYTKYCPLYVTLSDDKERMYLSSDNSDWATDTYDTVKKSDYDDFVAEYFSDNGPKEAPASGEVAEAPANESAAEAPVKDTEITTSEVTNDEPVNDAERVITKEERDKANAYMASLSNDELDIWQFFNMLLAEAANQGVEYFDSNACKDTLGGYAYSFLGSNELNSKYTEESNAEFIKIFTDCCRTAFTENEITVENVQYVCFEVDKYKDVISQLYSQLDALRQ